jgi:hypothetical protein
MFRPKVVFLGFAFMWAFSGASIDEEIVTFPCDAFAKNADGSWTPTREVTFRGPNGQFAMRPGVSFRPEVACSGMDLAAVLERLCESRRVIPPR